MERYERRDMWGKGRRRKCFWQKIWIVAQIQSRGRTPTRNRDYVRL